MRQLLFLQFPTINVFGQFHCDVAWRTVIYLGGTEATNTRTKTSVYESRVPKNILEDGKAPQVGKVFF